MVFYLSIFYKQDICNKFICFLERKLYIGTIHLDDNDSHLIKQVINYTFL